NVQVNFDLNDPDKDGRMYFQEIVAAFDPKNGSDSFLTSLHRLINVSGEITGQLKVYASLPFVPDITYTVPVPSIPCSFDAKQSEPDPVLADKPDAAGVLRINMGPRAGQRLFHGDTIDNDETFVINAPNGNAVTVTYTAIENGVPVSYTQTFTGVT